MSERERIRAVVVAEILKLSKTRKKELSDEMNLELDLEIDSLNKVELASNLFEAFSLEDAPVEAVVEVATVGDVVNFVAKIIEGKEN